MIRVGLGLVWLVLESLWLVIGLGLGTVLAYNWPGLGSGPGLAMPDFTHNQLIV